MREISITEFKQVTGRQLLESGESFEVFADGEYVASVVLAHTNYIREHVKQLGILSDTLIKKE